MDFTHISLRRCVESLVLRGQREIEVFVNMCVFEDVLDLICKNMIRLMLLQVSIFIVVTLYFILVFIAEHNFCYCVCQSVCKALFNSDLYFFMLAY